MCVVCNENWFVCFFMYRVMFLVLCYGFFLCVCLFVMKIVFFFFITFCLCPEHDIYE